MSDHLTDKGSLITSDLLSDNEQSAPAVTPEARAHSSCKETSEDAVSVVPYKPKETLPKERVLGYQT